MDAPCQNRINPSTFADRACTDRPNDHRHRHPARTTGERIIYADDHVKASPAVRELTQAGVDVTAVGRRIIVSPETASRRQLATLSEEDFLGGVDIIEAGELEASRVIVRGDGLVGEVGGPAVDGVPLEAAATDHAVLDLASAFDSAQTCIEAFGQQVAQVRVPPTPGLHPDAPVTVNELVPGAIGEVAVNDACGDFASTLRLTKMDVRLRTNQVRRRFRSARSGERVTVAMNPIGALGGGM